MRKWLVKILFPRLIEDELTTYLNSDDLRKWLCMAEAVVLIKVLESKIKIVREMVLDKCRNMEEVSECRGKIIAYQCVIDYVKIARKPKEEKPNGK